MGKKKVFSYLKGYTFSFEENGSVIEAWFSALSGLEKVYVNGELVSSQRNLSTDTTNSFSIGPNQYSTNLKIVSLFKGPFVCTLSKNGKGYKRQRLVFPKTSLFILRFLSYILLFVLFICARFYWQLSDESVYLFLAILLTIIFTFELNKRPVIEDEGII